MAVSAIELEGVVKRFDGETVLDGVDLTIPESAITTLLGPSGAGKTVTVKHVVGLLKPDEGTVRVDGRDLSEMSDDGLNELRRKMGVVLQGTLPFTCGLFYSLSVYENVAFPLRDRTNWSDEHIRSVTMEHLGQVGMADRAEAMPNQLSAGMTKRVALARALAVEPRILIIDDFDSGIDGVRLALTCELLQELQLRTGATLLLSTHHMDAARRLADHAAVIHEGRIVASGDADDIFTSEDATVRQLVSGATEGPIQLS
ncbi:MAG TPA: ATP-binding cassette domain-containing protein [Thermoleophilaceae bacterium]|jgi:phospholipid/cholesterol/gamma-HCH transport system ATP-binding protein